MLCASLHGIMSWMVPLMVLVTQQDAAHQTMSFWAASLVAFTAIFLTIHLKFLIIAEKPMRWSASLVWFLEVLVYVPIVFFLGSPLARPFCKELSVPESVPWRVAHDIEAWLCILLVPCAAVFIDLIEAYFVHKRKQRLYDSGDVTESSDTDTE